MPKIIQHCQNCTKPFETLESYVKRGQGRFCTRTCFAIYNNKHNKKLNRIEKPIEWDRDIAYLVGLITTDGTLQRDKKRIGFINSDFEAIEHAREIIKNNITGRTYKPIEYTRGKSKWHAYRFTSYSFYDFCLSIGLHPNKSLTLTEVNVPDEYFADFFRGVLDGDGNLALHKKGKYINTVIASGSEDFLYWLKDRLTELYKIEGGAVHQGDGVLLLSIAHYDSLKILSQIYKDDHYALTRKKNIALPYLGKEPVS